MSNEPEFDLEEYMKELAKDRPIFHSEADFQFALAWKIQKEHADAEVRLEYPFRIKQDGGKRNRYIDILVSWKSDEQVTRVIPIELKYKTAPLTCTWRGESFHLKNQSAQDFGRYDSLKDIMRIEHFADDERFKEAFVEGYTVWLTNDKAYWKGPKGKTKDWQFSLKETKEATAKTGKLKWDDSDADYIKSRKNPIELTGEYPIKWKEYHAAESLEGSPSTNTAFKYAISTILPSEQRKTK